MIIKEKLLITAGGRIACNRCQAMSKRTKNQCSKPALRGKNNCGHHGGKSTGPRTAEGKELSRQAHIKSGAYTKQAMLRQSRTSLNLAILEMGLHMLGMTSSPWTRGRKPNGFKKATSLDGLEKALEEPFTLA